MNKKLSPETIIPQDLYVNRSADEQIKELIENMGRPGYILVSRQMGKTNLLINAKRNLESPDDIITYIDLSNKFESARDCFRNIIDTIIETNYEIFEEVEISILNRREKVKASEHKEHSHELRLLLKKIKGKLVISLDEIDSLTQADYSDKIFAQIRSVYFDRVNFSEFNRLTYILSGVAEPSDIIKDSSISPFNIGQKIFLGDFSQDEYKDFLIKSNIHLDKKVEDRIFFWTNGNPRLTWEVCSSVEDIILSDGNITTDKVDEIIKIQYLTNYDKPPIDHIRTLVSRDSKLRDGVIALKYGKSESVSDDIKSKLYLSGILDSNYEKGKVKIKNRIIDLALDDSWLENLDKVDSLTVGSADSSFSNGAYSKAITQYESLLNGANNLTFDEEQIIYYKLAASYHSIKDYTKVIECCDLCKIPSEQNKAIYLELLWFKGSAYQDTKENDKASIYYLEIIELDKESKSAIYYRACIDYLVIKLDEYSNSKDEEKEINETFLEIIEELNEEYKKDNSKLKEGEISDLLSLVLFTMGTFKRDINKVEESKQSFISSLDYAIGDTKFLPLLELLKLEVSFNSEEKSSYLNDAISFINHKQRTVASESADFSLTGKLIREIVFVSAKIYTREETFNLIDAFYNNVNIENENFFSTIVFSALDFVKANDYIKSLMLFEYIFSQDRKNADPEDYYFTAKWICYLDNSNKQAKSVYFERFLNYTEIPDNIDFSIFESEIIELRDNKDDKKATALCDVFLGSEGGAKNEFSNRMIPIIFLKMLCHNCNDERLNIANKLKDKISLLSKSDYGKYRLDASSIKHMLHNSNQVIAELSPIEQVHYKNKRYQRNEKVKVQFSDGTIDVKKFKLVEELIKSGECKIL
ncbi:AAA-like domain-containing protein [Vibrio lentus]|uniref:tetratricopeptide repeat protein n=1 Tax=Vibrio TaxID=662 RepID=UPI000C860F2D|nr:MULTISPECIES: AAA-like domain-containing protein [Vibrio]MCC4782894.1 AAA-like domain-containing protein [Vibrio lentus]PMG52792.1 hypothetical protein BCU89_19905 [Vibrio splendidus]PMJ05390.1 hypothetical protein BCU31_07425 [Vibrio lentus]